MEIQDYIIGGISVLSLVIGLKNMYKKEGSVTKEEFIELSNLVNEYKEILRNSKA